MTWFLNENSNRAVPVDAETNFPLTSFWDAARSAAGVEWQDANWMMQRERQRNDELASVAERAYVRVGEQAVLDRMKQKGQALPSETEMPWERLKGDFISQEIVMEVAREAASANPGAWTDLDVSAEGIDARVTERRAKELADNEAVIAMSPYPGLAGFVGTVGAAMADPLNLALTFATGGGGSIMRVMMREAAVNTFAEAVTLPARIMVAKELNKPEPNVAEILAIGAIGGAALGGGIEALARGVRYLKARETVPKVPGFHPVDVTAAMDAGEDAILAGESPVGAVEAVLQPRSEPPEAVAPSGVAEVAPPAREPLVPDPVAPVQPAAVADPFERIAAPASQDEISAAQAALDEARAADFKVSRPLANYFRKRGGIDPDSPLGQELKARGVSSKTLPGLSKRTGAKSLDGLPARELEDDFPGITEAAGLDETGMYLDQNGLLELLIDSAQGGSHSWLRTRADADAAMNALMDAENPNRTVSALEQFQAKEKADDGFFVDLDAMDFDDPNGARLEQGFDAWSARRYLSFTPDERAELLTELRRSGGDAEFLIERQAQRNRDEVANELDGAGSAAGADSGYGPADGIPWDNPGEPRQAGTVEGQPAIASERTAAGEQTLIPGVAPVAPSLTRPAPVRGPQEADSQIGGMFDLAALSMRDMFDDPEGPKTQAFLDSMVVDLKAELETTGDVPLGFTDDTGRFIGLTTDDGRQITSLEDMLDEIEANDTLAREIDLCRTGGAQ